MRKKVKRMSALICALILAIGVCVMPASAAPQPKGPTCPGCSGNMVPNTTYGTWTSYEQKCQHGYTFGTDKMQRRTITTVVKCVRCGIAYPPTYTTETRFVSCHGYN